MLSTFYVLFLTALLSWVLVAKRKELPLLVLLHAIFQYVLTLAFWFFQMNADLVGLLLGYIALTSVLLVWARGLNYSKELVSIRLFFSMVQWVVVLAVVVLLMMKSPYTYLVPSSTWQGKISPHQLSLHPMLKVCGNILCFTGFLHFLFGWGQRWNLKKSFFELSPVMLYIVFMAVLRMLQIKGTGISIS